MPPPTTRYMNKREVSRQPKKELDEKASEKRDYRPKFISAVSNPTSSQPVVIPTRTSVPKRRIRKESVPDQHDSEAVPPSMAALLALASVHNTSPHLARRNLSEKLSPDDLRFTLSSSSPKSWNILQSSPDEDESKDSDAFSMTSVSTVAPFSSFRSLSSDSMPSLDMESDLESPLSLDAVTPSSRARVEQRKIVSPRSSLSGTEHPLSPPTEYVRDLGLTTPTQDKPFELDLPVIKSSPARSLKSNLTASIRMLKSAARTTISTISPTQYTINPLSSFSAPVSSQEIPVMVLPNIDNLPFHLTSTLPDLPQSHTSIQLMPYTAPSVSGSSTATAPPVFLPAASPSTEILKRNSATRPREPRENGDFLRVVVMEMNMRRAGKLNSEGRARIWLAARSDVNAVDLKRCTEGTSERSVPPRWRAIEC